MKKLMISTAFIALAGSAATAQDAMFRAAPDQQEILASDFIGQRVYSSETPVSGDAFDGTQPDWQDIGEVNDVILSRDGSVDAVLIDIGGFLGMGERQVAVDMSAVRFVSDRSTEDPADYFLVMNASRANLEGAPEYTRDPAAMGGDPAAMPAEDKTAMETTVATGAAVEGDAAAASGTTTAGSAAATDGTAVTGGTAATATNPAMDPAMRKPMTRDGYETAAQQDMTTEMLTGARVYDATDEWIGEVSELIIDDQGKITDAVVDVGGFLGIGEKPVKLAISELDILRETGGGELRVYVSMTREELEAQPSYEK